MLINHRVEMMVLVTEAVDQTLESAKNGLQSNKTGPNCQLSTLCYGLMANLKIALRKVV